MRLNLGCSTDLRAGYLNVDIVRPDPLIIENFQQVNLAEMWPWEDSSVDEIYAADIAEHIGDCRHLGEEWCDWCVPRRRAMPFGVPLHKPRHPLGRIHWMNECWRALRAGGILRMECPDAAKGAGQWQDCTHVTPWTPNGLQYFVDGSPAHKRFAEAYGITARFKLLSCTETHYVELAGDVRCEVWKFRAILEAVK